MPQITQQSSPSQGKVVSENKIFRDRLRDRYQPLQFVRVINIDDEPFTWQVFPQDGEETSFTDNGAVRVVTGRRHFNKTYDVSMPGNEQLWEIKAGDSEVLQGYVADLFIEGLYKRLIAKKKLTGVDVKQPGRTAINFNWNDGTVAERLIDDIFLGVVNPSFDEPNTETKARPGRPPKAQ